MEISRAFTRWDEYLPEQYHIIEEEWRAYADKNLNLVHYDEYRNESSGFPNYFIVIDKKKELGCELYLMGGRILISYDQIKDDIVVELDKIASELNAMFLINSEMEYPKAKIIAAQKRLAKRGKVPEIEYQKESFSFNNLWISIRADVESIVTYFGLSLEEISWQDGLEAMNKSEGIFLFHFRGWTFLAGQRLEELFDKSSVLSNEQKYINSLIELGKIFSDVQLYIHYDRSVYINGYYRVLNGKLFYGEYSSEEYRKKHGKLPYNLKHLAELNPGTAASEWSYDPDYLRYQKETNLSKVWLARSI